MPFDRNPATRGALKFTLSSSCGHLIVHEEYSGLLLIIAACYIKPGVKAHAVSENEA